MNLNTLPPAWIIFFAATVEIENEHNVILCVIFPVPSTLPGTNRASLSFVILSIFVKFTTCLADDGFIARSASLAQIGASFFFEAFLSSFAISKTN